MANLRVGMGDKEKEGGRKAREVGEGEEEVGAETRVSQKRRVRAGRPRTDSSLSGQPSEDEGGLRENLTFLVQLWKEQSPGDLFA